MSKRRLKRSEKWGDLTGTEVGKAATQWNGNCNLGFASNRLKHESPQVTNPGMNRLSDLIKAVKEGDRFTSDQLLPLVYQDLRKLAASKLAREKPGQTLQPTALVHEAYLRLVDTGNDPKWQNLRHFFAAASEAMRWILVDRARSKNTQKNGGQYKKVAIDLDQVALDSAPVDLLAFNETLDQLASIQPSHAEMVKLRFFVGLTLEEAAQVMGISLDKIKRDWTSVRAWLYTKLESFEGLAT